MHRSYSPPEWITEFVKDPNWIPPYTGWVSENGKLIKNNMNTEEENFLNM